jgi:DNA-binding MurR/RpiR family transcriptional regulator
MPADTPSLPPTSLDEFINRLKVLAKQEFFHLSARYVLDHIGALAALTRYDLAVAAQTTEVEVARLTWSLGFLSFAEMRAFVRTFAPGDTAPAGQIDVCLTQSDNPLRNFFRETIIAEIRNCEDTYARNEPKAFIDAIKIFNAARDNKVVILGRRSCYSAAYLFYYIYNLFRGNAFLAQDAGGISVDALRWLGPGDVLLVISLAPYTQEIVETVKFAKAQGIKIIAITDEPESPLALNADATLYFESATQSFFHSLATLNLLMQTLAALLFYSDKDTSVESFGKATAQLKNFSAYYRGEELKDPNSASAEKEG